MKPLLLACLGLLIISSCKDKDKAKKTTSITVNPSAPSVRAGETLPLTAAVVPAEAAQDVIWTSSEPTIANINASTGVATGVAKGSAIITATAADGSRVTGTATLTVTARRVTSVTVNPSVASVRVGETLPLAAVVAPADATQTVSWTSANPTIAAIDAVSGVVTGAAAGTVAITAAAADGSGITGTATLTITASREASVSAITLGEENFNATVPAAGQTATLANAPRTILSVLAAVKVNITAAAHASIKIGSAPFTQGQTANFANSVTFTVTAQDGTTVKSYTIYIPAYDAATNPYGIYTAKHLADVNNGLNQNFLLKNDITLPNKEAPDAAVITGIPDYASAGWLPLDVFDGIFDGGGFVINNFYVNRTEENVGLFGRLRGTVKSLGVNGATGTAAAGRSGTGWQLTGILAGSNDGIIDKCCATGNISAFSSSSSSDVRVAAGILAGYNFSHISHCYAAGNASSSDAVAVAVVSAGGLTGGNKGSISHCYATGNASSSSPANAYAGGVAGYVKDGTSENCYRNSNATITKNGINISASPDDASIAGIAAKTKAEMQTDAFKNSLNGASGTIWGRSDSKNDKLPYLIGVGVGK